MKENVNLVLLNKNYLFFKRYCGKIRIFNCYHISSMGFWGKLFRLIINDIGIIMNGLFFDGWYKKLKKGEKVIFFDEVSLRPRMIKIMNKYYKQCVLYLWNPVCSIRTFKNIYKVRCPICTFSLQDSKRYRFS